MVDPEDDLPSADYAGDFETTAIPAYDSSNSRVVRSDYDDGELPYSETHPDDIFSTGSTGSSDGEDGRLFHPPDQRGTQDLGLLLLRLGLGMVLIVHGLQKVFGWWGGHGLSSFRKSLTDAGYEHADVLTYLGAGGQIAAGLLLVFGLFTPLAAAGALAYLLNAVLAGVSAQEGHLSFFRPGDHEYQVLLVLVAVVVVLVGPGRYALDGDRGWARRPFVGSFVALLLGIGGGVAMWVFLNGANPLG